MTVKLGDYNADVLYAGSAPGFAGLLQVNVRVPEILAARRAARHAAGGKLCEPSRPHGCRRVTAAGSRQCSGFSVNSDFTFTCRNCIGKLLPDVVRGPLILVMRRQCVSGFADRHVLQRAIQIPQIHHHPH